MNNLPRYALSIRQPWAWAIVHAGKDIENRNWFTNHRGPICIHAAKGMTKAEFDGFVALGRAMYRNGRWPGELSIPEMPDLQRGGIIGTAEIVDCVSASRSPWFQGPWGFVLANVRPLAFIPCKGALGFFEWTPAEGSLL